MRDEPNDPAWDAVRSWTELRGEAKLAWWYIWTSLVRRRPDSTWLSYCELGADQGTGERSGRRAVRSLIERRLVEELESLPGRVRVYVREPREVVSPPRDRTGDNDRPLFDQLAARDAPHVAPPAPGRPADVVQQPPATSLPNPPQPGSADVAQEPPADVAQLPPNAPMGMLSREGCSSHAGSSHARPPLPSKGLDLSKPLPSCPSLPSKPQASTGSARHTGLPPAAADVAHDPPGGQPVLRPSNSDPEAAALAALASRRRSDLGLSTSEPVLRPADTAHASQALAPRFAELLTRLPGDADRMLAVSRLVDVIQRRVGDPALRRTPAVRVARAVIYGELPELELATILDDVESRRRRGELKCPFAYFVRCAKNAFARHSLPWPATSHSEAAPTPRSFPR